jgi:serine/threonine protein kinase
MHHHLPPRAVLGGKYRLDRVLGEGGFGITYLGTELNLDLCVAIKEYFPANLAARQTTATYQVHPFAGEPERLYAQGRDKFLEEARRLARFRSLPGIVPIIDYFTENGTAYIVMEYIEGQTLKAHLAASGGKLPAETVFAMMRPLMESLVKVHAGGMIHRDISPDNLMIGPEGRVSLIDFGAARDFGSSGTSLSVVLKPGYAPPEQYSSSGRQGPWTDVYALCATMYRAITGTIPAEAVGRTMSDTVKPPSEFKVGISPASEAALMRGLSVSHQQRFRDIGELLAALYSSQPLPVRHPPAHTASLASAPYTRKVPRRFRWKPLAWLVLFTAVIVWTTYLMRREFSDQMQSIPPPAAYQSPAVPHD